MKEVDSLALANVQLHLERALGYVLFLPQMGFCATAGRGLGLGWGLDAEFR